MNSKPQKFAGIISVNFKTSLINTFKYFHQPICRWQMEGGIHRAGFCFIYQRSLEKCFQISLLQRTVQSFLCLSIFPEGKGWVGASKIMGWVIAWSAFCSWAFKSHSLESSRQYSAKPTGLINCSCECTVLPVARSVRVTFFSSNLWIL